MTKERIDDILAGYGVISDALSNRLVREFNRAEEILLRERDEILKSVSLARSNVAILTRILDMGV